MMLIVKLFAQARQIIGSSQVELTWTDGQSVRMLKTQLAARFPDLRQLVPQLLVAVNNDYAADDVSIQSTDEVACFPPVSGG